MMALSLDAMCDIRLLLELIHLTGWDGSCCFGHRLYRTRYYDALSMKLWRTCCSNEVHITAYERI